VLLNAHSSKRWGKEQNAIVCWEEHQLVVQWKAMRNFGYLRELRVMEGSQKEKYNGKDCFVHIGFLSTVKRVNSFVVGNKKLL